MGTNRDVYSVDAHTATREWMAALREEIAASGEPAENWYADFFEMNRHFEEHPPAMDPATGEIDVGPFLEWAAERWHLDLDALIETARQIAAGEEGS